MGERPGQQLGPVVATVLFGLNTISLIFSLGRASITIIFVGLGWLAGLVGTVFLWPKDTSAYISSAARVTGPGQRGIHKESA